MMSGEQLRSLNRGDVVRHQNGLAYVVLTPYGGDGRYPIAVREMSITNLTEWEVIKQHDWKEET